MEGALLKALMFLAGLIFLIALWLSIPPGQRAETLENIMKIWRGRGRERGKMAESPIE